MYDAFIYIKSHATVQYINKFKYQGSVKNIQQISKKRKLNEKEEKHIVIEVKRNPRTNSPKLC